MNGLQCREGKHLVSSVNKGLLESFCEKQFIPQEEASRVGYVRQNEKNKTKLKQTNKKLYFLNIVSLWNVIFSGFV